MTSLWLCRIQKEPISTLYSVGFRLENKGTTRAIIRFVRLVFLKCFVELVVCEFDTQPTAKQHHSTS